ncbi:MAG: hypothetical protein DWQ06_12980 [Calditrichaeota bacterium]|nr:MAG: hypothetical protein DWQ06_12980 [Calditrichota bacterium]
MSDKKFKLLSSKEIKSIGNISIFYSWLLIFHNFFWFAFATLFISTLDISQEQKDGLNYSFFETLVYNLMDSSFFFNAFNMFIFKHVLSVALLFLILFCAKKFKNKVTNSDIYLGILFLIHIILSITNHLWLSVSYELLLLAENNSGVYLLLINSIDISIIFILLNRDRTIFRKIE